MSDKNATHSVPVKAWGIVPAAGIGSRMASATPKQYMELLGRPVIAHTLDALLADNVLEQVVVSLSPEDITFETLGVGDDSRVVTTIGGASRADSVLAGLNTLQGKAHDQDWVVVHDAARPCLRPGQLSSLIDILADNPVGGILALPMADTVKQSGESGQIISTVPRETLWRAQTPQVFRYALLVEALQSALKQGIDVTDEAMALEVAGHHPQLVEGSPDNIKITWPSDLGLAQWYMEQRGSQP